MIKAVFRKIKQNPLFSSIYLMGSALSVASAMIIVIYVYALKKGLYMGNTNDFMHTWVESFPQHFAIISMMILLLLLISVLVGVIWPGWKLSRVNPVDALRDE